MKIAIFGAQGKFGSELCKRLETIKPEGIELLPTFDRKHNSEIAKECDLAILAVRPSDVESLIREIAPFLKNEAQILSFAAVYPLDSIRTYSGRKVGRMMGDPWWSISAYFLENGFNASGLEFLFSNVSTLVPRKLHSDSEIDTFTVLITYLFAVLLLYRNGEVDTIAIHIAYLTEQLGIAESELLSITQVGDSKELLTVISTRGGLTEKIVSIIRANKEAAPEEILKGV